MKGAKPFFLRRMAIGPLRGGRYSYRAFPAANTSVRATGSASPFPFAHTVWSLYHDGNNVDEEGGRWHGARPAGGDYDSCQNARVALADGLSRPNRGLIVTSPN